MHQLLTVTELIFEPGLWAQIPRSFRCVISSRSRGSSLFQSFTSSRWPPGTHPQPGLGHLSYSRSPFLRHALRLSAVPTAARLLHPDICTSTSALLAPWGLCPIS